MLSERATRMEAQHTTISKANNSINKYHIDLYGWGSYIYPKMALQTRFGKESLKC